MSDPIRLLYPTLVNGIDYYYSDIAGLVWRHPTIAQPSAAEIDSAYLGAARIASIETVKQAAAAKYAQYASAAPGKDAVYAAKQQEAVAYSNSGANDGPVGLYMQARISKTGETAAAVAGEWLAKSAAWNALAAQIDAIQDKAAQDINASQGEAQCQSVADAAMLEIEAL